MDPHLMHVYIVWIECITYPFENCVQEARSFFSHAGFYMRFIQDFSKKAFSLSKLMQKALTTTPIIQTLDWIT